MEQFSGGSLPFFTLLSTFFNALSSQSGFANGTRASNLYVAGTTAFVSSSSSSFRVTAPLTASPATATAAPSVDLRFLSFFSFFASGVATAVTSSTSSCLRFLSFFSFFSLRSGSLAMVKNGFVQEVVGVDVDVKLWDMSTI